MDPLEEAPWADTPPQSTSSAPAAHEEGGSAASASGAGNASSATTTSMPSSSGARPSRTAPRRLVAQPTRLQAVEDDPLGPLGAPSDSTSTLFGGDASDSAATGLESPPVPPLKELPLRSAMPAGAPGGSLRGPADSHRSDIDDLDDAGAGGLFDSQPVRSARVPPPVAVSVSTPVRTTSRPSVSIEQASKPVFQISVGDPHKIGGATGSHIEYSVKTKVSFFPLFLMYVFLCGLLCMANGPPSLRQTTSKAYRQPEFIVNRRYRDFLWLYNQLHANCPGVVIPPPPEKQAMGRFESNFVESRRAALEKMLNKIAAHPTLQQDGDLKLFLESEAFNVDVKHKERKEPNLGESKGIMSSLGINVGGGVKFVEQDDVRLAHPPSTIHHPPPSTIPLNN